MIHLTRIESCILWLSLRWIRFHKVSTALHLRVERREKQRYIFHIILMNETFVVSTHLVTRVVATSDARRASGGRRARSLLINEQRARSFSGDRTSKKNIFSCCSHTLFSIDHVSPRGAFDAAFLGLHASRLGIVRVVHSIRHQDELFIRTTSVEI